MPYCILACCEKIEISGGDCSSCNWGSTSNCSGCWFEDKLTFFHASFFYQCVRYDSLGSGTYTKIGVDVNGRPIYKNDRYKGTLDNIPTRGEGNMILALDNYQRWIVSIYKQYVI